MNKKILFLIIPIVILSLSSTLILSGTVFAAKGGKTKCTTIKDGTIEYGRVGDPNTEIIPIGYDKWGYNYQAHMFNGWYWNNQRPEPAYTKDTIDQAPSKT